MRIQEIHEWARAFSSESYFAVASNFVVEECSVVSPGARKVRENHVKMASRESEIANRHENMTNLHFHQHAMDTVKLNASLTNINKMPPCKWAN